MRLSADDCQDPERAFGREWLETNGRGSYAAGTIAFAQTRKYHGLLVTSEKWAAHRTLRVNGLEEWVALESGTPISSAVVEGGAISPSGFERCVSFDTSPWPTWRYRIGEAVLVREVFLRWGKDAVVVGYRLEEGPESVQLHVRPLIASRDYQSIRRRDASLDPRAEAGPDRVRWQPYRGCPSVVAIHSGEYHHRPEWRMDRLYPVDRARGMEALEDQWSPGEIVLSVRKGAPAYLVLGGDELEEAPFEAWRADELERRAANDDCPAEDPLVRSLWRLTPTFISRLDGFSGIVAGYPWFGAWGRDTFSALTGLCLVPGRYELASEVIHGFANDFGEGLLPDDFDPHTGEPTYNTIDGALWFISAVGDFLAYTGDLEFVRRTAWPAIREVVDWYCRGTQYGIRVDHDGLLRGGAQNKPLTWMDAVTGEEVHTPRTGKPVEVQALWVRALAVVVWIARLLGEAKLERQCTLARAKAIASFRRRFWYGTGGYLYDVIDGPGGDDHSLRPNQIYAVSLEPDLLEPRDQARVVQVVQRRLLTPFGLRSLDSSHPGYRPRYEGDLLARNRAYHNGTVWPFLLGPFVKAWLRVHGKTPENLVRARRFFDGVERALSVACLDHLPEIFDAAPPHAPRGCIAQAWSNAEILQTLWEEVLGHRRPAEEATELRSP